MAVFYSVRGKLGTYLCSAGAILGEHSFIQGHQTALPSSCACPRFQNWDRLNDREKSLKLTKLLTKCDKSVSYIGTFVKEFNMIIYHLFELVLSRMQGLSNALRQQDLMSQSLLPKRHSTTGDNHHLPALILQHGHLTGHTKTYQLIFHSLP